MPSITGRFLAIAIAVNKRIWSACISFPNKNADIALYKQLPLPLTLIATFPKTFDRLSVSRVTVAKSTWLQSLGSFWLLKNIASTCPRCSVVALDFLSFLSDLMHFENRTYHRRNSSLNTWKELEYPIIFENLRTTTSDTFCETKFCNYHKKCTTPHIF